MGLSLALCLSSFLSVPLGSAVYVLTSPHLALRIVALLTAHLTSPALRIGFYTTQHDMCSGFDMGGDDGSFYLAAMQEDSPNPVSERSVGLAHRQSVPMFYVHLNRYGSQSAVGRLVVGLLHTQSLILLDCVVWRLHCVLRRLYCVVVRRHCVM